MAFLFITIWLLMLLFIFIAAYACSVSPFRITIPQIFIGLAVIMSFLGYPILFFQLDDYRKALGLTDHELIIKATVASGWSIIGAILIYGLLMFLSTKSGEDHARNPKFFRTTVLTGNKFKGTYRFFWSIILLISFCGLLAYLSKVPNVALFEAFRGGNVALARSLMTNDFSGDYHWYRLMFYDLSWLSSLAIFAGAVQWKSKRNLALFIVSFIFTSFCLLITAQKAPLIFYLGTLFLLYSFLKNRGHIKVKQLFTFSIVAISFLILMYSFFMGSSDPLSALKSTASRALTGQLSGAYNYQLIFPEHIDYLHGRSFPNPQGIFPFEHFPLTKEVMAIVYPHLAQRGIAGSQPTIYWAEAYANFGWTGAFAAPMYVGFFMFLCSWVIAMIKIPAIKGTAIVWAGFHLGKFAFSGLSWSFLPVTLVVGFMVIFFCCLFLSITKPQSIRYQQFIPDEINKEPT